MRSVTGAGQGRFAASDAVGRYWLAHCDGFEACSSDGRLSGVVTTVELDYAGRASRLHVDRGHGATLEIGSAAVTAVDPWKRLVVLTLPPRNPRTAPARAVSAAAVRGGRSACVGTAHAATAGAVRAGTASLAVVAATRQAAPPARRVAARFAVRAAYVFALAAWLYAVAVFSVTRVAVRVLLVGLAGLLRFAAWAAPPVARGVRRALDGAGERLHQLRDHLMRT